MEFTQSPSGEKTAPRPMTPTPTPRYFGTKRLWGHIAPYRVRKTEAFPKAISPRRNPKPALFPAFH